MVNDMSAVRPQDLDNRDRESLFARAENEHFDVLVIGGGITGTGVARSAASRGLSVALIEAQDLASGTSSRSSKMIHGGVRYLAQGDVGLVRDAARERPLPGADGLLLRRLRRIGLRVPPLVPRRLPRLAA